MTPDDDPDVGPDWPTVILAIVLIAVVSVVSVLGAAWLFKVLHSFGVN